MWSRITEEVKIVNDSMTCFSQCGDQRGLKNADLFNKSYSLKIVINCPWKFLKSPWNLFVWSCTNLVPIVATKGCIENWVNKEAGVQHNTFHVKTLHVLSQSWQVGGDFWHFNILSIFYMYVCDICLNKRVPLIKHCLWISPTFESKKFTRVAHK